MWTGWIGGGMGAIALALLWHAWRWPRRLWRVATRRRPGERMTLQGLTVPGRVSVVFVSVHQFVSEGGAAQFAAPRSASLCVNSHKRLDLPGDTGATGGAIGDARDGRLSFSRGGRHYIIVINGLDVLDSTGPGKILDQSVAVAR